MVGAARRPSKSTSYWNVERASFAITVAGLLIGGAVGWTRLDGRIENLENANARIEQRTADARCTQILMRQIAAFERGDEAVQDKIDLMAREQGCIRRYGVEMAAATRPMTEAEKAEAARREAKERLVFERDMAEIDRLLGIHPEDPKIDFLKP